MLRAYRRDATKFVGASQQTGVFMIRLAGTKSRHFSKDHGHVRRSALVLLAAGGLAVALVPAAAAAGVVPSTTTVSASPSSATVGTPVTLTAKVAAAVVGGVVITPSGTVTFTSSDGTTTSPVGTATLGSCLLSACTASLTTAALPAGTKSVTGTYSGDSVVASSSGSTAVNITAPTPTGNSSTVTCGPGALCDTGTVKSNNGNGTMDVVSSPSASTQTVSALLEIGKALHCPQNTDNQTGPLGTFATTVNDTTKTVTYTGNGNVAAAMFANYTHHPTYAGCFGSPTAFNGYVNGVYGPAILVHESYGNFYEAQLSNCANNGGQRPCFTNIQGVGKDTYKVTTDMADPKLIG
jgi:hypothetical protein